MLGVQGLDPLDGPQPDHQPEFAKGEPVRRRPGQGRPVGGQVGEPRPGLIQQGLQQVFGPSRAGGGELCQPVRSDEETANPQGSAVARCMPAASAARWAILAAKSGGTGSPTACAVARSSMKVTRPSTGSPVPWPPPAAGTGRCSSSTTGAQGHRQRDRR